MMLKLQTEQFNKTKKEKETEHLFELKICSTL